MHLGNKHALHACSALAPGLEANTAQHVAHFILGHQQRAFGIGRPGALPLCDQVLISEFVSKFFTIRPKQSREGFVVSRLGFENLHEQRLDRRLEAKSLGASLVAFDSEDNVFLLPGPVKMHSRVRMAMAAPAMAHRSPEFGAINRRMFDGLKQLMDAPRVAVLAGSGTVGMEAAISNLVHWHDNAIGLENGKFGQRMGQLVQRYAGDSGTVLQTPWGQGFDLDALEAKLAEGASAVCFTLNETSTAVMNQGEAVAKLCRKYDALSIADTITATGSVPVPMTQWDLDVSIVGSQKCIGGPSGLSFVALSDRAYEKLDSPSLYMDLKRYVDRADKDNQTPFTAAVPLHLATVEALDRLFEEGLDARFARTKTLANACRAAAEAAGLDLAAEESVRSDTVTAIRYPDGIKDKDIRPVLKEKYGVVVAGAQDQWKGDVFRVGHMGDTTWAELAAGWAAIESALRNAGATVPRGAAVAAMMDHVP